jgi:TPR repeat protein
MSPISPKLNNFDNPFPVFPVKKGRTSEEQTREDFSKMDISGGQRGPSLDGRPVTSSSKTSQDSPRGHNRAGSTGHARTSPEHYQSQSRQGQYREPQRQDSGYGVPSPSQYSPGGDPYVQGVPPDFGLPPQPYNAAKSSSAGQQPGRAHRSNTLPDEDPAQYGRNGPGGYLEPAGRGAAIPRPSTASGDYRSQRGPPPIEQGPPRSMSRQNDRKPTQDPRGGPGYYPDQRGPEPYAPGPVYDEPGQYQPGDAPRALNFSRRPQGSPPGAGGGQEWQQDPRGGNGQFSQQAKRSRSQPDLRGQSQDDQGVMVSPGYDGAPAMPDQYGRPPQGPPGLAPYNGQPPPNSRGGQRDPRGPPGPEAGYGRGFQPDPRGPPMRYGPDGRPLPPGQYPPGGPPPGQGRGGRGPEMLPEMPPPVRPGLAPVAQPVPPKQYPQQAPAPVPAGQAGSRTSGGIPQEGPVTLAFLEQLRNTCRAQPQNMKLRLQLATNLVEASTLLANEGGRADANTTQRNRENYIFEAHKILKRLVAQSYPDAMFYLADCYGRGGLGLQPDMKEAFNLYLSAAKLGNPQAAYRTAVCCELGHEDGGGTAKDPVQAIQWYKRAAAMGDTPAMYKMGMILLKGLLGQPKNPKEAVNWLKRAANNASEDNPHALHELAQIYENTDGNTSIVKDLKYAKELYTRAAELNYKNSQFRLGCAYEYGNCDCEIDPRQSIYWYSRAAVQGEHQSELALSGWYLTGSEGVLKQSDTEAYLWARKAATGGLAKAEFAMGYFIESGIGSPTNVEEAKKWYNKAAGKDFAFLD